MARSHAAPHLIQPTDDGHCADCGRFIAWVETEGGSRNRSHWRHKPEGYHWGDRYQRLRDAAQTILDAWDTPGTIAWPIYIDNLRTALRETK